MKKIVLIALVMWFSSLSPVMAIVEPLEVPNNRVGVHILSPEEIQSAAQLVNSNGGDWGYVVIPMRSNDRDRTRWLTFFEQARALHVIPIIRLATYPDGANWVSPDVYDLADFANFLSDMPWPTKNRYVILFNEPNHSYEWGGQVNPFEYATLIVNARQIFKERSQDFFLLSAGLDMSAPNTKTSMDAFRFYQLMTELQPKWYEGLDGLSMHAYPNPAFSASVFSKTRYGITSYIHEQQYLSKLGFNGKPIFISETGTINDNSFYEPAFTKVWTDENLVAVTPFVLFAGSADFSKFSLLDINHAPKKTYQEIVRLTKIKGSPLLSNVTIASAQGFNTSDKPEIKSTPFSFWKNIASVFNIFSTKKILTISNIQIEVEVMDTEAKRNQGLSGRESLSENAGMLFVFPKKQNTSFWMKDMKFALDFIWINDGAVVELTENVPPPSQTNNRPQVITPKHFVNQVLEVPSGFIKRHEIKVGDAVKLN